MSREIDALIAEHVMGWTDKITFVDGRPSIWPSGKLGPIAVPHYSTDIKAAWEVVEKLHESYPEIFISIQIEHVECTIDDTPESEYTVFNKTAQMAIALAALKAKNIEVPDE